MSPHTIPDHYRYAVLDAPSTDSLALEVYKWEQQGCRPQGGVATWPADDRFLAVFYQAVVR